VRSLGGVTNSPLQTATIGLNDDLPVNATYGIVMQAQFFSSNGTPSSTYAYASAMCSVGDVEVNWGVG